MKPEKNSPLTDTRLNATPKLVAVIDIGASSLRMQISEIDLTNHQIRNLESFSQAVSVGKDSFTKHHITKKNNRVLRSCAEDFFSSRRRHTRFSGVTGV
eukprot:COSAG05_NODE_17194_length_330_cov_0.450216_1_plen_98_part_01